MAKRFDEWCNSEAERKLRDSAANTPPKAVLAYYGFCLALTIAILLAFGVFIVRPAVDWGFDTYGHWAGLFLPVLFAVLGLWAWLSERAK